MPPRRGDSRLPLIPLTAWVQSQLDEEGTDTRTLAFRCGISEKVLYRWRFQLTDKGRPTFVVSRFSVEDALHRAGVFIWEVYPHLADEPVDVREDWCHFCSETVAVDTEDRCLWCENPTGTPAGRRAGGRLVAA